MSHREDVNKGGEPLTLEDFVRQALLEICNAVQKAQSEMRVGTENNAKQAAMINPIPISKEGFDWKNHEQKVEFDVLLTADQKNIGKAGLALKVFSIGTERDAGAGSAHRVKFSVPVLFTGSRTQDYMTVGPKRADGSEGD